MNKKGNKLREGTAGKDTGVVEGKLYEADSNHWTKMAEPSFHEKKQIISEPYDPFRISKPNPAAAAIFLNEYYNRLCEMRFDNAMADMAGLFEIMRHNPHFKPETNAIRNIIEGENVLNQLAGKADALI